MHAERKASRFNVSTVVLTGATQDGNRYLWRGEENGKVIKIVNPIFGTSRLQRQHKLELSVQVNTGTWKQKAGAGMRVEICEWDYAALDSKRIESDSEESVARAFGYHSRKKSQQPRLRHARAIQFQFKHIRSPRLIEQPMVSLFGLVLGR